jgi:hypothetical protein
LDLPGRTSLALFFATTMRALLLTISSGLVQVMKFSEVITGFAVIVSRLSTGNGCRNQVLNQDVVGVYIQLL